MDIGAPNVFRPTKPKPDIHEENPSLCKVRSRPASAARTKPTKSDEETTRKHRTRPASAARTSSSSSQPVKLTWYEDVDNESSSMLDKASFQEFLRSKGPNLHPGTPCNGVLSNHVTTPRDVIRPQSPMSLLVSSPFNDNKATHNRNRSSHRTHEVVQSTKAGTAVQLEKRMINHSRDKISNNNNDGVTSERTEEDDGNSENNDEEEKNLHVNRDMLSSPAAKTINKSSTSKIERFDVRRPQSSRQKKEKEEAPPASHAGHTSVSHAAFLKRLRASLESPRQETPLDIAVAHRRHAQAMAATKIQAHVRGMAARTKTTRKTAISDADLSSSSSSSETRLCRFGPKQQSAPEARLCRMRDTTKRQMDQAKMAAADAAIAREKQFEIIKAKAEAHVIEHTEKIKAIRASLTLKEAEKEAAISAQKVAEMKSHMAQAEAETIQARLAKIEVEVAESKKLKIMDAGKQKAIRAEQEHAKVQVLLSRREAKAMAGVVAVEAAKASKASDEIIKMAALIATQEREEQKCRDYVHVLEAQHKAETTKAETMLTQALEQLQQQLALHEAQLVQRAAEAAKAKHQELEKLMAQNRARTTHNEEDALALESSVKIEREGRIERTMATLRLNDESVQTAAIVSKPNIAKGQAGLEAVDLHETSTVGQDEQETSESWEAIATALSLTQQAKAERITVLEQEKRMVEAQVEHVKALLDAEKSQRVQVAKEVEDLQKKLALEEAEKLRAIAEAQALRATWAEREALLRQHVIEEQRKRQEVEERADHFKEEEKARREELEKLTAHLRAQEEREKEQRTTHKIERRLEDNHWSSDLEEEQVRAATQIQARFRGAQARATLEELRVKW
jgi:hypothetical protein